LTGIDRRTELSNSILLLSKIQRDDALLLFSADAPIKFYLTLSVDHLKILKKRAVSKTMKEKVNTPPNCKKLQILIDFMAGRKNRYFIVTHVGS
jgi:hypothetical protein